jgi:excisionase family DNA binding protein
MVIGRSALRGSKHRPWLTTSDVMGTLRVTRSTVYRLVRSAALPAARVGGQLRFKASDVDMWLEERRSLR